MKMKISLSPIKSSALLAAALLALASVTSAAGNDAAPKTVKKSEINKEERANTKLPPCVACSNLVTSFDLVSNSVKVKRNA